MIYFVFNNFNETKINPEKFEKDDKTHKFDSFVNIYTNLKKRNYRTPKSNEQKKIFTGKKIPAIASIIAVITLFDSMKLFTLILSEKISFVKYCCFNTFNNQNQINNPNDVIHIEDQEYNYFLDGIFISVLPG